MLYKTVSVNPKRWKWSLNMKNAKSDRLVCITAEDINRGVYIKNPTHLWLKNLSLADQYVLISKTDCRQYIMDKNYHFKRHDKIQDVVIPYTYYAICFEEDYLAELSKVGNFKLAVEPTTLQEIKTLRKYMDYRAESIILVEDDLLEDPEILIIYSKMFVFNTVSEGFVDRVLPLMNAGGKIAYDFGDISGKSLYYISLIGAALPLTIIKVDLKYFDHLHLMKHIPYILQIDDEDCIDPFIELNSKFVEGVRFTTDNIYIEHRIRWMTNLNSRKEFIKLWITENVNERVIALKPYKYVELLIKNDYKSAILLELEKCDDMKFAYDTIKNLVVGVINCINKRFNAFPMEIKKIFSKIVIGRATKHEKCLAIEYAEKLSSMMA